ncbi:MAG TPA: ferrochelatase [Steroidobacteraceae bacterium]|nr:ferrochelatase [Steroidobacteraceae bacterium]
MSRGRTAVLLLNVGSPDAPTPSALRRYLRTFLDDPRVVDLPAVVRKILVHLIIVPTRAPKSAKLYQRIWTNQGSPLIVHTRAQAAGLESRLDGVRVAHAMRNGTPAIAEVVERLLADCVTDLVVLPLFPQYASASAGTAVDELYRVLRQYPYLPSVRVVGPFFDHAGYLDCVADDIRRTLAACRADHLLFSYHGLPVRQLHTAARTSGGECRLGNCCDTVHPGNHACYRAQCLATSRALAARVPEVRSSTAFQSRLKGAEWMQPYTDATAIDLARQGVRRLAVVCPSFVSDCLETVSEIGIELRDEFIQAGGEELALVPCPNDDPAWLAVLADLARREMPA